MIRTFQVKNFSVIFCGFKILQYQSAHLPTVASPVGVHNDFITDGQTGFLCEAIEQWVEKTSLLIEDAPLRKQMGQAAAKKVKAFDIAVLGKNFCEILLGISEN